MRKPAPALYRLERVRRRPLLPRGTGQPQLPPKRRPRPLPTPLRTNRGILLALPADSTLQNRYFRSTESGRSRQSTRTRRGYDQVSFGRAERPNCQGHRGLKLAPRRAAELTRQSYAADQHASAAPAASSGGRPDGVVSANGRSLRSNPHRAWLDASAHAFEGRNV